MEEEIIDSIESVEKISEYSYPGISERIKAAVIDSIVLLILMVIIANVFSIFEDVGKEVRVIAFIFVFGLYDPIFTSALGGTIGHFIIGIRVIRDDQTGEKILFPLAVIRYLVKALLGWISLLSISKNEKSKAIHDIIIKSLVVYKNQKR